MTAVIYKQVATAEFCIIKYRPMNTIKKVLKAMWVKCLLVLVAAGILSTSFNSRAASAKGQLAGSIVDTTGTAILKSRLNDPVLTASLNFPKSVLRFYARNEYGPMWVNRN